MKVKFYLISIIIFAFIFSCAFGAENKKENRQNNLKASVSKVFKKTFKKENKDTQEPVSFDEPHNGQDILPKTIQEKKNKPFLINIF